MDELIDFTFVDLLDMSSARDPLWGSSLEEICERHPAHWPLEHKCLDPFFVARYSTRDMSGSEALHMDSANGCTRATEQPSLLLGTADRGGTFSSAFWSFLSRATRPGEMVCKVVFGPELFVVERNEELPPQLRERATQHDPM